MNLLQKVVLLFLVSILSSTAVFATGQTPDNILYKGTERALFTNPLEAFYEADPEKRPNFRVGPMIFSSGNWRGYVATWEIADGKLYLTKVDSWICTGDGENSCTRVELSHLFPDKVIDGKVLADWFTGKLRVPDGNQLQYVHMGYGSIYERDLFFNVSKGNVSEPEVIDNTKRELDDPMVTARKELEKLKESPLGDKPMFGPAKPKPSAASQTRQPKSGVTIVPGKGVFSVGTKRSNLETIVGDGTVDGKFDDVYFVDYPTAGVEVSYENGKDIVHVIFLYNNARGYEKFITPIVKTEKGIGWDATDDDIIKAYGKPLKDFGGNGENWRRLEYRGIDFRFEWGRLIRIGILGTDGA